MHLLKRNQSDLGQGNGIFIVPQFQFIDLSQQIKIHLKQIINFFNLELLKSILIP